MVDERVESGPPIIPAIDRPKNLLIRLAYRLSQRQFGKVLGVLKVIYARKPLLALIGGLVASTQARGLSFDPSLRALVQAQVSRLNGCAFCHDLVLAQAVRQRIGHERFAHLEGYRTSQVFSERERAALRFAEEATLTCSVTDDTWAAVRACFSDTEIVELVWLNAAENYFNLQAAILRIDSDGLLGTHTQGDR
jgi:alkylhydroperoxidase family enzyme